MEDHLSQRPQEPFPYVSSASPEPRSRLGGMHVVTQTEKAGLVFVEADGSVCHQRACLDGMASLRRPHLSRGLEGMSASCAQTWDESVPAVRRPSAKVLKQARVLAPRPSESREDLRREGQNSLPLKRPLPLRFPPSLSHSQAWSLMSGGGQAMPFQQELIGAWRKCSNFSWKQPRVRSGERGKIAFQCWCQRRAHIRTLKKRTS